MDEYSTLREAAFTKIREVHDDLNAANRRHADERSALEQEIMDLKAEKNDLQLHLQ
jgi:hypothetical protein